jgi:hypothetical protein
LVGLKANALAKAGAFIFDLGASGRTAFRQRRVRKQKLLRGVVSDPVYGLELLATAISFESDFFFIFLRCLARFSRFFSESSASLAK